MDRQKFFMPQKIAEIFTKIGAFLFFMVALLILSFTACGATQEQMPGDGVFVRFETDKGKILAQLEFQKAPLTVMSFVGLAEGLFDTPNAPKGKPYFDGLNFHRVEPGFVIQGGDPNGDGTGGPGYQFPNEIDPGLVHDKEGILSMANAGPNTNGSQFFITLGPASFLDGGYSVFGHVVEGMDVVKQIEKDDNINKVRIYRQGKSAKAFQPTWEKFQAQKNKMENEQKNIGEAFSQTSKKALQDFIATQWPAAVLEEADGLLREVLTAGSGPTGGELSTVKEYRIHYNLWAPDAAGKIAKVDSSFDRGDPIVLAPDQVIQAWRQEMPKMQVGEKRILLVPSELGYGTRGSPPLIQPNSYLLFEMELLGFVR